MGSQTAKVAWLMGSDSDLPKLEKGLETLKSLGIPFTVRVLSAHRTPGKLRDFVDEAASGGVEVFVAAAGAAAHLAGAVAALTTRPVIGIPMPSSSLNGLDALLSTVQMPGGVPVACMAIGEAGAKNAALFAAQILSLSDPGLAALIRADRERSAKKAAEADEKVRARFGG